MSRSSLQKAVERIPTNYPTRRIRSIETCRNELLHETIYVLTGIERDKKECSSHLQVLKNYSAMAQSETTALSIIEDIFRTRFIKKSALAGELFSTFQSMYFGRGPSILERLHRSVSPGLLAATADISFTLDNRNWEFVPWQILNRSILPCLEKIYIDLDFKIGILRGGHEKQLWTTLEQHMQETVANKGAKEIILWLNLADENTNGCNEPRTIQQFETMLAPRMGSLGWKKYRGAKFILTHC